MAQPTSTGQPATGPRKYDGQNGNMLYDDKQGGHYGACQKIACQGQAPPPEVFTGTWANVSQGLTGQPQEILNVYWQNQVTQLESEGHDFKLHQLPLARIKKVMKADPDVKMISAEAPILFAKGCDMFITELTMRAWIHAEENKRRTLQRSDIASALSKSDMFDFLIDIVPREEAQATRRNAQGQAAVGSAALSNAPGATMQQTGAHPPPHEHQQHLGHAQGYGMDAGMTQQPMYQQPSAHPQTAVAGMPQGDPSAGGVQYPGQHGGQMFGEQPMQMYPPYGMPPQQPVGD